MLPPLPFDGLDGTEDRRGTDDAPAEGRRNYDKPDSLGARAVDEVASLRRLILGLAVVGGAVLAILGWFGFRAVGPGARVDEIQSSMDHNKIERVYQDSVISVRLSRLERVVTTMAYQSCISDGKTPRTDCARIFTDGVN